MWIEVNGYKCLPPGGWLVEFDTDREHDKYGFMFVRATGRGTCATCGNAFAFDLPRVVKYADIPSHNN